MEGTCGALHLIVEGYLVQLEVVIHIALPLEVLFGVMSPKEWNLIIVGEVKVAHGSSGLELVE